MRQIWIVISLCFVCSTAYGDLDIVGNRIGTDTPTSTTASSTGSLNSIFEAASMYWENLIGDDETVNIDYKWENLSGLGQTTIITNGSGDVTSIVIAFDINSFWYIDGSPYDHSEYSGGLTKSFGSGGLTNGEYYTGGPNAFDLLSTAIHEIGHALHGPGGFPTPSITVQSPLPGAGTVINTLAGSHLDYSEANLGTDLTSGYRQLISDYDLLAVAQAGGFSNIRSVPEPSPAILLTVMGIAMGTASTVKRIRRRRQNEAATDTHTSPNAS